MTMEMKELSQNIKVCWSWEARISKEEKTHDISLWRLLSERLGILRRRSLFPLIS